MSASVSGSCGMPLTAASSSCTGKVGGGGGRSYYRKWFRASQPQSKRLLPAGESRDRKLMLIKLTVRVYLKSFLGCLVNFLLVELAACLVGLVAISIARRDHVFTIA